ncbi:hypothetical protein Pcinc_024270 [Petrolisthes cinctipes]|uniref:Uncharacterized protein n=1 Tax=Petrolisthes cinctipes TaxID=88211 RepID=A0AAE1KFJ8_PETCI|nr:hypothetical protein Pcinc_024270 [Petrolisthes cinctipes]
MVWAGSREFGVGKARSRSGKIIVVAHYSPAGNIEHCFKDNVQPLNTRALAAEILGQVPGEALVTGEGGRRMVEGQTVERVLGVFAAQPPRLTGRNATKVIAAHLLGHSASLVSTPDEQIEVVINRQVSPGKKCKRGSGVSGGASGSGNGQDPSVSTVPDVSCCPARFRLRTRASVSPADVQSSVIHERPDTSQGGSESGSPLRHWLQSKNEAGGGDPEGPSKPTEVIELKRGDLETPSSDAENFSSLSVSASPRNTSLRPKRARLRRAGRWTRGVDSDSETSDLEIIRSESPDSVDSQSRPEPVGLSARRTDSGVREDVDVQSCCDDDGAVDKHNKDKINMGLKIPFDVSDTEHGRLNYYALSPVRY